MNITPANAAVNIAIFNRSPARPIYAFSCLRVNRTIAQGCGTLLLNYGSRLAPVLAGLRNPSPRSLGIALASDLAPAQAKVVLQTELQNLIQTIPDATKPRSHPQIIFSISSTDKRPLHTSGLFV